MQFLFYLLKISLASVNVLIDHMNQTTIDHLDSQNPQNSHTNGNPSSEQKTSKDSDQSEKQENFSDYIKNEKIKRSSIPLVYICRALSPKRSRDSCSENSETSYDQNYLPYNCNEAQNEPRQFQGLKRFSTDTEKPSAKKTKFIGEIDDKSNDEPLDLSQKNKREVVSEIFSDSIQSEANEQTCDEPLDLSKRKGNKMSPVGHSEATAKKNTKDNNETSKECANSHLENNALQSELEKKSVCDDINKFSDIFEYIEFTMEDDSYGFLVKIFSDIGLELPETSLNLFDKSKFKHDFFKKHKKKVEGNYQERRDICYVLDNISKFDALCKNIRKIIQILKIDESKSDNLYNSLCSKIKEMTGEENFMDFKGFCHHIILTKAKYERKLGPKLNIRTVLYDYIILSIIKKRCLLVKPIFERLLNINPDVSAAIKSPIYIFESSIQLLLECSSTKNEPFYLLHFLRAKICNEVTETICKTINKSDIREFYDILRYLAKPFIREISKRIKITSDMSYSIGYNDLVRSNNLQPGRYFQNIFKKGIAKSISEYFYKNSHQNETKLILEFIKKIHSLRFWKKKCSYLELSLANLLLKIIMNNFGIASLCENPQNIISKQNFEIIKAFIDESVQQKSLVK